MVKEIATPFGVALPPAGRHAVTFHMPGWDALLKFVDIDMEMIRKFQSVYPRMMLNADVKVLMAKLAAFIGQPSVQACFIFTSRQSAEDGLAYATSEKRKEKKIMLEKLSIREFDIVGTRIFCLFFPFSKIRIMLPFWTMPGLGISTRLAVDCLENFGTIREVTDNSPAPLFVPGPAHATIRQRVASLLERAPRDPPRSRKITPEDIYLFPTGMAAIYLVHQYLLKSEGGSTVLFGFSFSATVHLFEEFNKGYRFYGLANAQSLSQLEEYLEEETAAGRRVQAVWTEVPSNPVLVTPDLHRLRILADKYKFALICDDSIGSFCNLDLLGAADIVITSLTKSFSGYADVMGASAAVSPVSPMYSGLKRLFKGFHRDYIYNADALVLVKNSEDYLSRSARINQNAFATTEYLRNESLKPDSAISMIHYPTTSFSFPCYKAYMRAPTPEFAPGYGGLYSVELDSLDTAIAFYNNLHVHQGVHLGAHLTLAIPYVQGLHATMLDYVGQFGLRAAQIRIAVGLEDTEELLEVFKHAVEKANEVKQKSLYWESSINSFLPRNPFPIQIGQEKIRVRTNVATHDARFHALATPVDGEITPEPPNDPSDPVQLTINGYEAGNNKGRKNSIIDEGQARSPKL